MHGEATIKRYLQSNISSVTHSYIAVSGYIPYFVILWHRNEKQHPVAMVLAKRLRENVLILKKFAIMMTDEILCANGRNIKT